MTLKKGNEVINLSNESHISAYLANGWKEVVQEEKKTTSTKKTSKED